MANPNPEHEPQARRSTISEYDIFQLLVFVIALTLILLAVSIIQGQFNTFNGIFVLIALIGEFYLLYFFRRRRHEPLNMALYR